MTIFTLLYDMIGRHSFSWALFVALAFVFAVAPCASASVARLDEASRLMEEGESNDALRIVLGVLRECESTDGALPDSVHAAASLLAGNIYLGFQDYLNSSRYYERGLTLTDDVRTRYKLLYNLSVNYSLLGEERKAREANRKMRAEKIFDRELQTYDNTVSSAFIEKAFGRRETSVALFRSALDNARRMKTGHGENYMLTPLSELSEYYEAENMLDSALIYLKEYEQLALRLKVPQMIADSQRGLMRVYIKNGNRDLALDYSNRYIGTLDSLVGMSQFIRINAHRDKEREEAANARIQNLQFTVSKQKIVIYAVGIILVFALLGWLYMKQIRGAARQLFARNREIAILETKTDATPSADPPAVRREPAQNWTELMEKINAALSDPANFCDPSFSIAAASKIIGVNSHYISDAINETTGDNFRALLNYYRIVEARKRLTSDAAYAALTIQSIGESVGFKSASNFIIAFKKVTGMTPSLYQKMTRQSLRKK